MRTRSCRHHPDAMDAMDALVCRGWVVKPQVEKLGRGPTSIHRSGRRVARGEVAQNDLAKTRLTPGPALVLNVFR